MWKEMLNSRCQTVKQIAVGTGERVIGVVNKEIEISTFRKKRFYLCNIVRRENTFLVKTNPGFDVVMCVALQLCCDSVEGTGMF